MPKLSADSVRTIRNVETPRYDRSRLTTGIVHFGVGNFHRAHQAMYIDRLMNEGVAHDWAICGVGVMPIDEKMRDILANQDYLYTLVLKHADGQLEPRIIGSIHEYLYAPDDPEAVLKKLSLPSTRIVSLTVTEGGYNFDRVSGEFDLDNKSVERDLYSKVPQGMFGLIVESLRRRRNSGIPPFTVMSCDNIRGNGDVARRSVLAFARAKNAELATWIEEWVSFPNTMVDRITPATTDADRDMVLAKFGINDGWPVVCEPFAQWVVEDKFKGVRPPLQDVGVQFTPDVEPYELMKLRLLNATHQGMAYFGYLAGYRYVHEAASDPSIVRLLTRYMDEEATPTLAPVPGVDLSVYKRKLIERFENPEIKDTLARLATDPSDRITQWLLPVIRENLATNRPIHLSVAIVASWARYAEGIDERGDQIDVVDPLRDVLGPVARAQSNNLRAFIDVAQVFGSLSENPRFVAEFESSLISLLERGSLKALQDILA